MIRVVIDTNVVVSANLIDKGPSAAILDLAANQRILMYVSPPVLAEYEEVLHRARLKLDPARITATLVSITILIICRRGYSSFCHAGGGRRPLRG